MQKWVVQNVLYSHIFCSIAFLCPNGLLFQHEPMGTS